MTEHLSGKKIVLAVTGGIAAYKSCELVRLLRKEGAEVFVAMTENAARFVTPLTFEALSGHEAAVSEWDRVRGAMPHITMTEGMDLMLIAPATANTIAKAASGIADNLVSALVCARKVPLAVAPAMNTRMWENPANQRNLRTLRDDGVMIWGPAEGSLACGESGAGRMIEPGEIAERVIRFFSEKFLAGKKILITAGPTYEPLDPVRGITNLSSGRQGYAIAEAALRAGAAVTLVSGPSALPAPLGADLVRVTTADEMRSAVMENLAGTDLFVGVAAVCDWKPESVSAEKMKKTEGHAAPEIRFTQNPDILSEVGHLPEDRRPVTVGFAAETENWIRYGKDKLERKAADMIVANNARTALGAESTQLAFVTASGAEIEPPMTKEAASEALLRRAALFFGGSGETSARNQVFV